MFLFLQSDENFRILDTIVTTANTTTGNGALSDFDICGRLDFIFNAFIAYSAIVSLDI